MLTFAFPLLGTDVMQRMQLLIVGKVTLCQVSRVKQPSPATPLAVHLPSRMFAMFAMVTEL